MNLFKLRAELSWTAVESRCSQLLTEFWHPASASQLIPELQQGSEPQYKVFAEEFLGHAR